MMAISLRSALLAIAAVACAALATSAQAAASRTFVSGVGNDGNPCTLALPCRTLQAALNATTPGGTIDVLDPTGYGRLSITKAVTIDGHGWAELNSSDGSDVVSINAGPNDVVNLRGLTVVATGSAANGIKFVTGGTLNIQNSVVRGFSSAAIELEAVSSIVTVSDTVVSGVTGEFGAGIHVTTSGGITVMLDHVNASTNSGTGISVEGELAPSTARIVVAVADCVVFANRTGINSVSSVNTAIPQVTVTNSKLTGNGFGLSVIFSTVWLAQSTITGNNTDLAPSAGGIINSFGNNYVDQSTTGLLTPVSTH
jgi:hypothetical protein